MLSGPRPLLDAQDLRLEPPDHAPPSPPIQLPDSAEAARRNDFAAVEALFAPLLAESGSNDRPRVILGLYAQATGNDPRAVELLSAASDPSGELEDLRLWALGTSAAASDLPELGREALASLSRDHPGSPLSAGAIVALTRLTIDQGDHEEARRWVEEGRRRIPEPMLAADLEALAFELGELVDDTDLRRQAAIRLLVAASPLAEELAVSDTLGDGSPIDWATVLSTDQIVARSRALLLRGEKTESISLLEAVPDEVRGFDWRIQYAHSLTEDRRGVAALKILASAVARSRAETADLAWARAQASRDASQARRGRTNLPSSERETMRLRARTDLWTVVDSSDDIERRVAALRQIYALLDDEQRFDPSIDVLHRLLRLSASDTTGARDLWERGWREFRRRNHSSAIGYWAELFDLYPESSFARSGRYWSAASYRALGESGRAEAVYRQLAAADAIDFYGKFALIRLRHAGEEAVEPPPRPTEPWPNDPRLRRARFLTDLGLDSLALTEIDLLEERSDARAWSALKGLALSRTEQHRQGIPHLRRAFPELGGPRQASAPPLALRSYYPVAYREEVLDNSRRASLPPELVLAMIRQESAFDAQANSWAGARGLMQLMPATAREWAGRLGLRYSLARLTEPDFSLRLGTAYFTQVLSMFDGTTELALAGYNGGPYRMKKLWARAGSDPELDLFLESLSIEESKNYVKRVLLYADSYRRLYPELIADS